MRIALQAPEVLAEVEPAAHQLGALRQAVQIQAAVVGAGVETMVADQRTGRLAALAMWS